MTDKERFKSIESNAGKGALPLKEMEWAFEYWMNNGCFECFITKVHRKEPWYVKLWKFIAD